MYSKNENRLVYVGISTDSCYLIT